jgi:serine/threonine protein kinase
MGYVYRAFDVGAREPVALKVLATHHAADREVVARFQRAAVVGAKLALPHVVRVIEFGTYRGIHYLAMELMEGGSVASKIEKNGPFPEDIALDVMRAMTLALDGIAAAGLIHRDLKPENILFKKNGCAKLGDLGLVKGTAGEEDGAELTGTGFIVGTPHYMAPEQALGKRDLDVRTDLYGLGITLFQMLTGRVPFEGPTPVAVLTKHLHEPLPDPRIFNPTLTEGTFALMKRLAAKRRSDRFQTPAEATAAIDALVGPRSPRGGAKGATGAEGPGA